MGFLPVQLQSPRARGQGLSQGLASLVFPDPLLTSVHAASHGTRDPSPAALPLQHKSSLSGRNSPSTLAILMPFSKTTCLLLLGENKRPQTQESWNQLGLEQQSFAKTVSNQRQCLAEAGR